MFADSFSVVYVPCVARESGASFLYKCRASRGGSLRQHGLLVVGATQLNDGVFAESLRSSL